MAKVIEDMTNEAYHSHPAVSKSTLDELHKSPFHYWLKYLSDNPPPLKWTDAFTTGAALHALVLEPQNFERDFAVTPALDRRTKAGKEAFAAFEEENAGKIIVKPDQYELCETMTAAIQSHPLAEQYADGFGKAEVSLFWEEGDIHCRARPDYIREDGVIVDVKTALSAKPNVWSRKAFDFRYHVQAAMYMRGFEACYGERPKDFVFVVVEKAYPHCVLVARAGMDFVQAGNIDLNKDLNTLRYCRDTNEWPSYNEDQLLDLEVPSYKRYQYEVAA